MKEAEGLLPVGLSQHATLRRPVAIDRPVSLDDIELDEDAFPVRMLRDQRAG